MTMLTKSNLPVWLQRAGFLLFVFLFAQSAKSRVFIRWTLPEIPPVRTTGVRDLVITWNGGHSPLLATAKKQGYSVYAEVTPEQAETAANASAALGLAGIIVKAPGTGPSPNDASGMANSGSLDGFIRRLQSSHPGLSVRLVEPGGKQPAMKGTMVVDRNGVLQVSSPTQQPWIDSNVAFIRFERTYHPVARPIIEFAWTLTDSVEQQYGPPVEDYELAVAEAGAFQADVILPLHKHLQNELLQDNPQALEAWSEVKHTVDFYAAENGKPAMPPISNVGMITGDYNSSYEAMNLMARHNIPFRVLKPRDLESNRLDDLALITLFSPLDRSAAQAVDRFAAEGGTAVLVGQQGSFPWQSSQPVQQNGQATVYRVGTGKVVEIRQSAAEPEAFAKDVWRLLPDDERDLSLWNALTTLAVAHRERDGSGVLLSMVNYSGEIIRVQVRVKGRFSQARYETPEHGCCASLKTIEQNGFTEFIVPSLLVAGRVHLTGVK